MRKLFSHNELNEAVLNTLSISDSSTAMSEEAVLTYFEGRGLGEIIQLMLSIAKIPVRHHSTFKFMFKFFFY